MIGLSGGGQHTYITVTVGGAGNSGELMSARPESLAISVSHCRIGYTPGLVLTRSCEILPGLKLDESATQALQRRV